MKCLFCNRPIEGKVKDHLDVCKEFRKAKLDISFNFQETVVCAHHFKDTRVVDSRPHIDGGIRRRRKCRCGFRFSTLEVLAEQQ